MKFVKYILIILFLVFLTILTQTGGVILLLVLILNPIINPIIHRLLYKVLLKATLFIAIYLLVNIVLIPPLAKLNHRVPLPLNSDNHLKPLNQLTYFLNRNYVDEELYKMTLDIAKQMNLKYPGTVTHYLEANFPLFNHPLFPHLSHQDGKKLDLAFFYINSKTGKASNECPSSLGYGVYVNPTQNEVNTTKYCLDNGYWQYDFVHHFVSQKHAREFELDNARTQYLLNLLLKQNNLEKLFIEPHLIHRLKLSSNKLRFHGCHSVRHDDHIHIQIK